MPTARLQAMPVNQVVETMPARRGKQTTRQLYGAQHLGPNGDAYTPKRRLDMAVIEPGVMRHEDPTVQPIEDLIRQLFEPRRMRHLFVRNAGHPFYVLGNTTGRPHQA